MSPKEMTKAEYVKRIKAFMEYIKTIDVDELHVRCPTGKNWTLPDYCNNGQPCDLCRDFISIDRVMADHYGDECLGTQQGCPCLVINMIGQDEAYVLILTMNSIQEWKEKKHKWQKKPKTKEK